MYLLLLLGLISPFYNFNQEQKKELAKLQGMWKGVQIEQRGQVLTRQWIADWMKRNHFAVVGDTFTIGSNIYGQLRIGNAKNELDLIITDGPARGTTARCLFENKGDELRLASNNLISSGGGPRPEKLDTDHETPHFVFVFKRDPTVSKEQVAAYLKEQKAVVAELVRTESARNRNQPATQEQVTQVLEKLEKLEKRMESLEKRLPEKK